MRLSGTGAASPQVTGLSFEIREWANAAFPDARFQSLKSALFAGKIDTIVMEALRPVRTWLTPLSLATSCARGSLNLHRSATLMMSRHTVPCSSQPARIPVHSRISVSAPQG